jgi:ribonuclease inhibitor
MIVELDGNRIRSEADFHRALAVGLGLPSYYGCNTEALWDILSVGVERPVRLIWTESARSAAEMPDAFATMVSVMRQDIEWALRAPECFELALR